MQRQMQEILVSYDVADSKKRTQLQKKLKDIGLISIQYSVMWGEVLQADVSLVRRLLEKSIDKESDKAFILPIKLSEKGDFYGIKPDFEWVKGHVIF